MKHLKLEQGPYVSLEPKKVALACNDNANKTMHKLKKFSIITIKNHDSYDSSASADIKWASDCIGLSAHMCHIGSVWASASSDMRNQEHDALKALAMGSERHIIFRQNKLYVIELHDILQHIDLNDFVQAIMKETHKNHEFYESRAYEACPYVLDELDLVFGFER